MIPDKSLKGIERIITYLKYTYIFLTKQKQKFSKEDLHTRHMFWLAYFKHRK